jgi:rhamnose transport system permease protein
MINGFLVAVLRVPSIVATLGTLSIYRGLAFLVAGGKQVTLIDLPSGYTDAARATVLGVIPLFLVLAVIIVVVAAIVLRQSAFGRSVYAVGSNPEAAEILGINARVVTFAVFSICGFLGGIAGILWGLEFGTINATAATGVTLQVVAAVVVGGVNIFGGSGTVVGAGLGAMFLAFISNALVLLSLSQFWLQAIYGVVILIAVGLDAALLRRVQRSTARTRKR